MKKTTSRAPIETRPIFYEFDKTTSNCLPFNINQIVKYGYARGKRRYIYKRIEKFEISNFFRWIFRLQLKKPRRGESFWYGACIGIQFSSSDNMKYYYFKSNITAERESVKFEDFLHGN